jgi:MYXO-CTERM domain-containing protein
MKTALFLFSAAALTSVACASAPEEGASTYGQSRGAIIKGEASTQEQDAVVLVVHTDRQTSFGQCTGALIAPNLVLTARHCVSSISDTAFGCKADGTPIGAGGRPGSTLRANEFYIFAGADRPYGGRQQRKANAKGAKVFHDNAKTLCGHDLALILLDQDIPDVPILPLRLEELPKPGETFTAVGWGITDRTQNPATRMQRSGIEVKMVGPFEGSFDEAPLPVNDFRVGESICSGDSGGPGIAEETGAILGVVSRGGNGSEAEDPVDHCIGSSTQNEYTAVAPFKDLILQAFEESGHEPWIEGSYDPRLSKFEEACEQGTSCRSGTCVAGKCAQTCSQSSDCPSGYECGADGSSKICKVPAPANAATPKSGGCVAGAAGPVGPVVPWALAALGLLAARRRKR